MAFVFAVLGLFVQFIFLFKREWLFEKRSFTIIYVVSIISFVLSYILMLANIGDPNLVKMLTVPFLAATMFYITKRIFFKLYGRNLEDTFWSMDSSLMSDGVFNAVFWFSGTVLAILFTYFVLP